MQEWITQGDSESNLPTIHIVSDSVGVTAQAMARAAAASFGVFDPPIEILSHISTKDQMLKGLSTHLDLHKRENVGSSFLLFFTLVDNELKAALLQWAEENEGVIAVDLLTNAVNAISQATGEVPMVAPGILHSVNAHYFKRIEAMEFTISHDDGRNPQDLTEADIVLIGVSRSSKTPLSIYLSQMGYKVANIPLDPQTAPPKEIYKVDATRLFGLMISPEILSDIRKRRLGNAINIAGSYADLECVCQDLESARDLMRKLGCIIVRTDNRAIEETAQEILRYYETAHPQSKRLRNNGENVN